ncbi:uncharacterized protein LOC129087345 isoform X2 [Pteronotus mesoamericanus]|uniref:uncharacterized protein LOC129087345 isoform X2 n=1 Tax=Pteronotus mesoamericanus TaxID=1884717 RepID=UPI0023EBB63E|nr:uncharacterized protein LOC129087345 isoform X2 [Pteronotus parnellii mesoamericanus]
MGARVRTAALWTKSVKFIITWNVIRKIKTSWEAWQIALSVLHLENYVFLLQIIFLQDRRLINVAHVERV